MVKVKVVQQDMKRGVNVQTVSAEISWIEEDSVLLSLSKEENCDCPLKDINFSHVWLHPTLECSEQYKNHQTGKLVTICTRRRKLPRV